MPPRIPLAYTFGNHMHWVDMQWLWGYDVLPGSVEDMLKYCREAGVKGNVNFDGIGYEKMASESPEHLAALKMAVELGVIEVVGGSYGQPYGLFHGGESNIRQRVYGVRTAMRVLGTRPRTFWEEEFDFYPQLPQMLAGCGFTGASLYFQWTWHTPEVPMEEAPVVLWEGVDGTRIPAATRNRMNLHQWPEDFQILLDDLAANPPVSGEIPPLVLQWLELMPTQDWMCRSELMLPMLAALKADPRFEVIACTLGEYLQKWWGVDVPVRKYEMDDVWHGMTLGKNGDNHPKTSLELEDLILAGETCLAILGLFGRPYEPWDVYPTWEIEEAWRNLLAAQHHDNHECEGLCGHVANSQFEMVRHLMSRDNTIGRLARRVGIGKGEVLTFNRCGWHSLDSAAIPPVGYSFDRSSTEGSWTLDGSIATFENGNIKFVINVSTLTIVELTNEKSTIRNVQLELKYTKDGEERTIESSGGTVQLDDDYMSIKFGEQGFVRLILNPEPASGSLFMYASIVARHDDTRPDPGYGGSVRLCIEIGEEFELLADTPYAVQTIGLGSSGKRKYPKGDWMTSPQWFETVKSAFTSQSFVNIRTQSGRGLLMSHSNAQQWFRRGNGIENVMLTIDPWDGEKSRADSYAGYRFFPHEGISNAECVRRSTAMLPYSSSHDSDDEGPPSTPPLPRNFSAVTVHNENVIASAFYREQSSHAGRDLPRYAAKGISHPYILRLVEYNGEEGDVEVTLPGPIAAAYKTNLLGELESELEVTYDDSKFLTSESELLPPFGIEAARVRLHMRANEIATIYLDIVPGRKQFRDLDAKREIWATVHRTED